MDTMVELLSPDKDYPKFERAMYILYVLDNANMVKSILTRVNSICNSCPYKNKGQRPCNENELCSSAIYSYLFHGGRNEKLSSAQRKKIKRWVDDTNELVGINVINERTGPKKVWIFKLSYPAFFVLLRLYHAFGEKLSLSWVSDFDVGSGVISILAWLMGLQQDSSIIREITKVTVEPGDLTTGHRNITLNLALDTTPATTLEIEIKDFSESNFQYGVRWYVQDEDFNILRWDNYHDEGFRTAPHHVHIHGGDLILEWRYYTDARELIKCVIALIEEINKTNTDWRNRDHLKDIVQNFKC